MVIRLRRGRGRSAEQGIDAARERVRDFRQLARVWIGAGIFELGHGGLRDAEPRRQLALRKAGAAPQRGDVLQGNHLLAIRVLP